MSVTLNDFVARALGKTGENRTANVVADNSEYETTAARTPKEQARAEAIKDERERLNIQRALVYYRQAYFKTKHLTARRQYETDTENGQYEWKPPRPTRKPRAK